MFKLLHEEGVSKDSILACMAALEFTPGMEAYHKIVFFNRDLKFYEVDFFTYKKFFFS